MLQVHSDLTARFSPSENPSTKGLKGRAVAYMQ
jgi:hypothetical protein